MSSLIDPSRTVFPRTQKPFTFEKPKGAKAMTIAVAFMCGEGVICPRTQR